MTATDIPDESTTLSRSPARGTGCWSSSHSRRSPVVAVFSPARTAATRRSRSSPGKPNSMTRSPSVRRSGTETAWHHRRWAGSRRTTQRWLRRAIWTSANTTRPSPGPGVARCERTRRRRIEGGHFDGPTLARWRLGGGGSPRCAHPRAWFPLISIVRPKRSGRSRSGGWLSAALPIEAIVPSFSAYAHGRLSLKRAKFAPCTGAMAS